MVEFKGTYSKLLYAPGLGAYSISDLLEGLIKRWGLIERRGQFKNTNVNNLYSALNIINGALLVLFDIKITIRRFKSELAK